MWKCEQKVSVCLQGKWKMLWVELHAQILFLAFLFEGKIRYGSSFCLCSFCYSMLRKEKEDTNCCITSLHATWQCRVGYYFCRSSPGLLLLKIAKTIWTKPQQYDILFQLFTNRQQVFLLFRWWSRENLGFLSMCWREDIKR